MGMEDDIVFNSLKTLLLSHRVFWMLIRRSKHDLIVKLITQIDCVGDGHKGPLNNQGKPAYLRKKTNANEPKNTRKINPRAHGPPDSRPSHPRAELRFARGARCRTGKFRLDRGLVAPSSEAPPRSGAGRPLERDSASIGG
jgi:hypothetical protein